MGNRVVEAGIALRIVFVALGNLDKDRLSPWRPWVVFGSGVVHGLGFAHNFGMPPVSEDFLPALFSFNMGIEAGQIGVVACVYALTGFWWKKNNYRTLVVRPASLCIAMFGAFWFIERLV